MKNNINAIDNKRVINKGVAIAMHWIDTSTPLDVVEKKILNWYYKIKILENRKDILEYKAINARLKKAYKENKHVNKLLDEKVYKEFNIKREIFDLI